MPLPLTISCSSKIQIGFTYLVPADPGSPGQRAVKRVCVCCHMNEWYVFIHWTWSVRVLLLLVTVLQCRHTRHSLRLTYLIAPSSLLTILASFSSVAYLTTGSWCTSLSRGRSFVKVSHPTRLRICHFRDCFISYSERTCWCDSNAYSALRVLTMWFFLANLVA